MNRERPPRPRQNPAKLVGAPHVRLFEPGRRARPDGETGDDRGIVGILSLQRTPDFINLNWARDYRRIRRESGGGGGGDPQDGVGDAKHAARLGSG